MKACNFPSIFLRKKMEDVLPPFALQILLENAVKHNIISEDNPLQINITNEDDFIFVKNNYQPRGSSGRINWRGIGKLESPV